MNKAKMIEDITKIMAKNWFNETITDTAERLVNEGCRIITGDSVVLTKEEYEGKEIVVEMSGGHNLRLTVGKFGEMSRVLEEFTRKETAKEFFTELFKQYSVFNDNDVIIAWQVKEALKELAKKHGVEVEE